MKVGYVRVSKLEQNEALQVDALEAAGCEKVFTDKISGAKFERKGLEKILEYVRPGDTLVVWKLDRLGRSLKDLIEIVNDLEKREVEFASLTEHMDTSTPGGRLLFHVMGALAEYERGLIRERTMAGLTAARARGRLGGRPRTVTNGTEKMIRKLMADNTMTIGDIVEATGVSRSTLYRYRQENDQIKKKRKS